MSSILLSQAADDVGYKVLYALWGSFLTEILNGDDFPVAVQSTIYRFFE